MGHAAYKWQILILVLYVLIHFACYGDSAAAKSLQSCPNLCDPRDGSPLGSSIRGIFQARVLDWGAIATHTNICSHFRDMESQIQFFSRFSMKFRQNIQILHKIYVRQMVFFRKQFLNKILRTGTIMIYHFHCHF